MYLALPKAEEAQVPSGDEVLSSQDVGYVEAVVAREQQRCGVDFSVYLGDLPEGRESALGLHSALGANAENAVLMAIDPGRRITEIVTGERSRVWVDDRACALATLSMLSSLQLGDWVGAIDRGLTTLGDQARHPASLHVGLPQD